MHNAYMHNMVHLFNNTIHIKHFFSNVVFGWLETIKQYLKITEKGLLCNMFDKAMDKGNTPDIDAFTKVQLSIWKAIWKAWTLWFNFVLIKLFLQSTHEPKILENRNYSDSVLMDWCCLGGSTGPTAGPVISRGHWQNTEALLQLPRQTSI